MAEVDEDTPVLRVEHSSSDIAGCQHAACKKRGIKIAKGELRLGKHQYFEPGDKWITLWRHWRCVPTQQIKLLKQLAEEDVEKVAGYDSISPESQEQIRLAFENDKIADNDFTDARTDLVKTGRGGRVSNVTGYKVDTASTGRAGCRKAACKDAGTKIGKGELRLGLVTDFQGHESTVYKHWKCATAEELAACKELLEQDSIDGLDLLPEEYKGVVLESIENGQAVEPPVLEGLVKAVKPRKPRAKKTKTEDEDGELDEKLSLDLGSDKKPVQNSSQDITKAKGKRARQGEKGEEEEAESTDEVIAPPRKKGRSTKKGSNTQVAKNDDASNNPKAATSAKIDPAEERIASLASRMRANAAQSTAKRA